MLQHEWILRTFAKWNKPISHTHTHKIQILQDFTSMRFLFSFPVMSDSVTPQTAACQASLSPTIFQSLPKFMYIASMMSCSHLILWCSLFILPSIFPSIRDFPKESSVRIRWPKHWNFSFSNSPSNWCSGLISLKIDWLDLLAVQGTLRSPPTPQFKGIFEHVCFC